MHDFRRRPKDLTPEQTQALEELFEKVPALGMIYHVRWQATEIFDTAVDRASAATALREWVAAARATELDWEPFIRTLEKHWDGILAYFEERRTSGPVEGINTKIRVVLRRGYGIPTIGTLWTRLVLDINWACQKVGQSIAGLRNLVSRIQYHFRRCYT
jgi:transposase